MNIKRTTALIVGGFILAGMSACAQKPGEAVMDTVRIRLSNGEIAKVPEQIQTKVSHKTTVDHADLRQTAASRPGKRDMSRTTVETTPSTTETVTETTTEHTGGGDAVIALKSDFGNTEARQFIVGKKVVGENDIHKFEAAHVTTDVSPAMGVMMPVGAAAGAFRDAAVGSAALWTANNYGKEVSAYQDYVNKWAPDQTQISLSNDSSSNSGAYAEGATAISEGSTAITNTANINNNNNVAQTKTDVDVNNANNNNNVANANAQQYQQANANANAQQYQNQGQNQAQDQYQSQGQSQGQSQAQQNDGNKKPGCDKQPHCMLTKPQPIATIHNGRITSVRLGIG